MKRFILFAALVLASGCAQTDTTRFSGNMHDAFLKMNGSPIHRFTLTPDNSTAEDNLTASGGTALAYTLFGGERICLQAVTTDAYIEIIAAASVTASGAKGFVITAGHPLDTNCFTLQSGDLKVSALCTAAGPCLVKGFEKR